MRVSVTVPLFLSSMDHNYNATLRLFGPPSIFDDDLYLPPLPPNTVMETNLVVLLRSSRTVVLNFLVHVRRYIRTHTNSHLRSTVLRVGFYVSLVFGLLSCLISQTVIARE
jgi:hypothetical protein